MLKRNRLEDVPNEILEIFMGFFNHLEPLQALVVSSCRAEASFETRQCAVIVSVIYHTEMNAHLQQTHFQIVHIRQQRKNHIVDGIVQTYTDELESGFIARSNSVDMPNDAVDIYISTNEAERLILKVQMPET